MVGRCSAIMPAMKKWTNDAKDKGDKNIISGDDDLCHHPEKKLGNNASAKDRAVWSLATPLFLNNPLCNLRNALHTNAN